MQDCEDHSLLRDYVERNSEEAFATLVARHVNKVYSVAMRHTGNPHQAEEITQAVFVILAKKSRGLGKGVVLSGWLYNAARLTSVTLVRSEIRRARRQQEAHMQTFANETEDDAWPQIAPLLDEAMANLNEADRHAVVLRFFDQKSMREVGNEMGASEDAAKKRVTRALEKLRKYFSKRGVYSTTAIIAGAISANSVQLAPIGLAKVATSAAIAKGAAVSGSTLTLIKGALKVMVWTKAKTVVVIGAGLLFATGTTVMVEHLAAKPKTAMRPMADPSWANDLSKWALNSQVLDSLPAGAFILRPTQFANGGGWVITGNRYVQKYVSLQTLMGTAYGFPTTRIVFPTNLPADRFDFLSTVSDSTKERLQEQLTRRFGLIAHKETRDMDVFRLKVSNPNPPSLRLNSKHDGNSSWIGGNQKMTIHNQSLASFFGDIESHMGQPVLDETGLTGKYDLSLQWQAKPGESNDAAYRRALLEQLGLQLVADRAPIEALVVEKVQ
jgi:uncharacterized protein (TIGR03435 family)